MTEAGRHRLWSMGRSHLSSVIWLAWVVTGPVAVEEGGLFSSHLAGQPSSSPLTPPSWPPLTAPHLPSQVRIKVAGDYEMSIAFAAAAGGGTHVASLIFTSPQLTSRHSTSPRLAPASCAVISSEAMP